VLNVRLKLESWARSPFSIRDPKILADQLGVSAAALRTLGCIATDQHKVWGFPMYCGDGSPVGIRMRHENGRKWALPGSHNGIFLPQCEPQPECVVCEGPTDSAAALTMGMFVIGRPNCSACATDIVATVKRLKIKRITIVADVDQDRQRSVGGGVFYNPGLDGARSLAAILTIPTRIVTLPCKDLRSFLQAGGSLATFESIANQLVWNKPK
jgi:hypothetical protein